MIGKNITKENFNSSLSWPNIFKYVVDFYKKNINDDDGWIFSISPNDFSMAMISGALSLLNYGNNRLYLNINQLLIKPYLYELLIPINNKSVFLCSSLNVENVKNAMTIMETFGIKAGKLIYLFDDKEELQRIKTLYPSLELICGPSTIGENK